MKTFDGVWKQLRRIAWGGLTLLVLGLPFPLAAEPASPLPSELESSHVIWRHRSVATLRAQQLGLTPSERAASAAAELERLAQRGGGERVTRRSVPQGQAILVNGTMAFTLLDEDADGAQPLEEMADQVVASVTRVLRESRDADSLPALIRAGGLAALASLIAVLLLWALRAGRSRFAVWLARLAHEKTESLKVGGELVLQRDRVLGGVRKVVAACYWLAVLLVLYEWLGTVFALFPATRAWGEQLHRFLLDALYRIGSGIGSAIPNLVIAFLILMLAKLAVDVSNALFERVERGVVRLPWLDHDSVRPTRRLVSVAIWLFAVAMAYPYLPGAQTAAFQGLSVLVGLMVSLGASSVVGQAASGLILMYTRTLRVGEYVSVGDAEGRVMELGIFSTRIRTGVGEELSVPNSLVLGNVTRNRSRSVEGDGYLVDASVTIGYDTPWRQVHAMLREAAARTRGVSLNPEPMVLQTALSDFYAEYRLVCRTIPRDPGPRPDVISTLHAHIQDVFNEFGVQIMSPHYIDDPASPKVVPRSHWSPPPAGPAAEVSTA